jgi:tRNA threonylcarbamoyladenosine biosynthesis protein TsaB
MKILAVDTTSASASVALCEDDFLLGEFYVNIKQTHSETLMPEIGELLSRCGVKLNEIGLFAVSNGPGSFTGVRIGVSAVKGMALPREVPCAAVSALEAAAMNLPFFSGIICAVMDARRGQFYNALFEASGGELTRLTEDRATQIENFEKELQSLKKNIVFIGDGAKLCYNELKEKCSVSIAPERLRFVRASGVAQAGLALYALGKAVTPAQLQPFYLRLPQAERELKMRTGAL